MPSIRACTSSSVSTRHFPTSSIIRAIRANAAVKLVSTWEFSTTLKKATLRPMTALRAEGKTPAHADDDDYVACRIINQIFGYGLAWIRQNINVSA